MSNCARERNADAGAVVVGHRTEDPVGTPANDTPTAILTYREWSDKAQLSKLFDNSRQRSIAVASGSGHGEAQAPGTSAADVE